MEQDCFSLEMAVRDYECDLQGVVNNAVYQNYLEHARHEYLKSINIDFAALAAQGINLVVTRIELDYKTSLTSGDRFLVEVRLERISPVRIGFRQDIKRLLATPNTNQKASCCFTSVQPCQSQALKERERTCFISEITTS